MSRKELNLPFAESEENEQSEIETLTVNESKADKFKRLSIKRVNKALKDLNGIMNLSSIAYESTPEEQEKIVNALRLKVLDIENSFKVKEKEEEEPFSL